MNNDSSSPEARAKVTLTVNGEQAKQMMSDLETKIKDTENRIVSLKKNMADPKDVEKARKQLQNYKKQLEEMQSATEGVHKALERLDTATPRQLEKALKTLNKQLKTMTPGTAVWNSHVEKITELKARLAELRSEVATHQSVWERFKSWAMGAWPAVDLLNQWGGSIYDVMRGAVDAFASMDQEMANVRKFTGLTAKEVASLNEEFKKLDTRTSREDLNKLAQEAGRLGKTSKEDILGFVRAADKINVALDDLGEGATLTLSKLTGIFGDEAVYGTEQSLLKVGSVINELSQNCSASAPYLANFAERMGGVGAQAGMTIPQIMGFAAVLDTNAQAVEASSTALSQVIVRMMQEPAKYAKVAGLDVERFTRLLKDDTNAALLLFLETLQKAGGMDSLSPMFKEMGENGSRAITALSTLATHIDLVKSQQAAANVAFAEGVSINKEAAIQNKTVQASIEKAKKAVNDMRVELGERLSPVMSYLITSSSAAVRALITLVRFIMDNKLAIMSLAAGIAAYNLVLNSAVIWTTALNVANKLLNAGLTTIRLAMLAVSGATALLSGNITRATAAFKLFSLAIKANPIGLVISLITTAIVAIGGWINKVNQTRKAEQELARQRAERAREFRNQISDISKTAGDYAKSELDRLKNLYDATQNQTKSQKERIAAVRELQKTYPSAFGNLSQEKILAGEAASAYETLANNIIKAARAKAAAEKIKDNEKLLLDLQFERQGVEESIYEDAESLDKAVAHRKSLGLQISNKNKFSLTGPSSREKAKLAAASSAVKNLNDNLDASTERLEQIIKQSGELEKANKRLSKIAGDPSKISPDSDFSNPLASNPSAMSPGAPITTDEKKSKNKTTGPDADRFAKEKAWREEQETMARLYYAEGEENYSKHTARMAAIAVDYYQMLLDRTDLSVDERMKVLSDYWTARNKETVSENELLLDTEDRNYQKLLDRLRSNHLDRLRQEGLNADERKRESEQYDEALELAELEHLKRIMSIYKEGSDERLEAQRRFQEKELEAQERHLKKKEELEREYEEKLKSRTTVKGPGGDINILPDGEKTKERINNLEKQKAAAEAELDKKLQDGLITAEEYESGLRNIEDSYLNNFFSPVRDLLDEQTQKLFDLGTAWTTLFRHISEGGGGLGDFIEIAKATTAVLCSTVQTYSQFLEAQKAIDIANVEKAYDREVELAQGSSYKIAKAEKKKEDALLKIKAEYAKKEFAAKILMAVAQTAQNALLGYAAGLEAGFPMAAWLAPLLASLATAQGMVQIALIKKQQQASQAQGYAEGGFTRPGRKDEPAGIVHAGEWVASQKLLANPVARPMIDALEYVQRTNTIGSLRPEDVSRSITANNSLVRIAESGDGSIILAAAASRMSATIDDLTDRLNKPFITVNTVTGDHGYKQAEDEYARLMNNVTPKSKRK